MPEPTAPAASPVKLEFYLDAYYGWDTDARMNVDSDSDPKTPADLVPRFNRQGTAVNFRRNEFNLNTAQMTASTQMDWFRGRATIQFGTIPQSSWVGADAFLAPVQEANLGIRPATNLGGDGNELWIDGGIFLTHIGNEALLPRYNWLSNLALVTMFEPFYQAGLRASYNWGSMASLQLHLLNAYGTVTDNNRSKDFGWLLGFNPLSNLSLSWAGQVGDVSNFDPATKSEAGQIRFYNNLNATYQIMDDLGVKGQVDLATEAGKFMVGGQVTARYNFLEKFGVTLRGEGFNDAQGMLTSSFDTSSDNTTQGIQGFGVTLGLEYRPLDNAFIRLEGRELVLNPTNNAVFLDTNGGASANRFELTANTGFWF
ncbi:MAG: outer membrane beta-barrel protein [Candidatus Sericytochromatia bacterium]